MSDDEDYMSDKFLLGIDKETAPSLIHKRANKREIELEKKKALLKEKNKPIKIIEQEKREEGLSSAISSDNKGFAMLLKMGYKVGQGIGKDQSGIVEPIPVTLKTDKGGLGKTTIKKKSKTQNFDEKLEQVNMQDFRGRLAQRRLEQSYNSDLYKSQKVCEQLDSHNNKEALEKWFWPPVIKTKDTEDEKEEDEDEKEEEEDEEEESELLTTQEKLEIITKYLRDNYFYCIWCGVKYNDEDDLKDSCPGCTRDDH